LILCSLYLGELVRDKGRGESSWVEEDRRESTKEGLKKKKALDLLRKPSRGDRKYLPCRIGKEGRGVLFSKSITGLHRKRRFDHRLRKSNDDVDKIHSLNYLRTNGGLNKSNYEKPWAEDARRSKEARRKRTGQLKKKGGKGRGGGEPLDYLLL